MGEFRGKTETLQHASPQRSAPDLSAKLLGAVGRCRKRWKSASEPLQAPQKPLQEWGPPHVWLLARFVSKLTPGIELSTSKHWHEDRYTADNVCSAVESLSCHLPRKARRCRKQ